DQGSFRGNWRRVVSFEQCISTSATGTAERPSAHWNCYRPGNCAVCLSRKYHCSANDARACTLKRTNLMAKSGMIRGDSSTSLGTTARSKRLLLFDIDGTLIHSGGAGVHALILAFKERFGVDDDFHDIEIAGMTDSGIVLDILKKHNIPVTHENVSGFLDSYVHFLSLELPLRKGKLLPGVLEL